MTPSADGAHTQSSEIVHHGSFTAPGRIVGYRLKAVLPFQAHLILFWIDEDVKSRKKS